MKHIIILFTLFLYSVFASALSANINVSGNVIIMPCEVEKNNYLVNLNKINLWSVKNSQVSPWVDFTIKLKNCPISTTQVVMTINGTSDATNSDYFINTGTSKNVALHLANTLNKTLIKNGTKITMAINNTNRILEIPLSARAVGYGSGMTIGSFKSHVEFTLLYN